jgi:hypothetical protein
MFFFQNYKAKFSTNSILKLTSSILKNIIDRDSFVQKKPKKNEKQIGGKKKNQKTKSKKIKSINNFEKNHNKKICGEIL